MIGLSSTQSGRGWWVQFECGGGSDGCGCGLVGLMGEIEGFTSTLGLVLNEFEWLVEVLLWRRWCWIMVLNEFKTIKYQTANWWFEDGHQLNRISIKPCMSITWVYITSPSLLLSLSLCLSIIKLDLTLTSTSTLDLIMSERTRIVIRHLPAALPEDVFWKTLSPWIEPNHHHNHSNQPIIIYKSYIPGKTRHRLVFIIFIFSSQLLTVFFFFFHQ